MSRKALAGIVFCLCLLSVAASAVPLDISGTMGANVKYTPFGLWEPKMTLSLSAGFTTGVEQHARLIFSMPVWPSGEKSFTDPTYSPLNLHVAETTLILQGSLLPGLPRTKTALGTLSINYSDYIGRPLIEGWANPKGIAVEGYTFSLGALQRHLRDLPRVDTFFAFGKSTSEFLYGARLQLESVYFKATPVWTVRNDVPTKAEPNGRTVLDWERADIESDLGLEFAVTQESWNIDGLYYMQRNMAGDDPATRQWTHATAIKADLSTAVPKTGVHIQLGYRDFDANFQPVFRAPSSEEKQVTTLRGQQGYSVGATTTVAGTDVSYLYDRYRDRLATDRRVEEHRVDLSRPIKDATVKVALKNVDDSTKDRSIRYLDLTFAKPVRHSIKDQLGFSDLTGNIVLGTNDELGQTLALTVRLDGTFSERLPGANTYFGVKYVTNTLIHHDPLTTGSTTATVPQLYVMAGLEHTLPNGLGVKARWATPTVQSEPIKDANLFEISASVSF